MRSSFLTKVVNFTLRQFTCAVHVCTGEHVNMSSRHAGRPCVSSGIIVVVVYYHVQQIKVAHASEHTGNVKSENGRRVVFLRQLFMNIRNMAIRR